MSFRSIIQALKGGAGSGNFGHSGRLGKRGGSAPVGGGMTFRASVVVDSYTTNEQFAKSKLAEYLEHIPEHIQRESSMRSLEVYENPEDATARINELEPGGIADDEYARGAYDRDTKKAVVSLYYSDDQYLEAPNIKPNEAAYSGRNFYHEFAHSLENKITSGAWEKAWGEWNYDQDEGFANAFAGYMVGKRLSKLGSDDELNHFRDNHPITTQVFKDWGL